MAVIKGAAHGRCAEGRAAAAGPAAAGAAVGCKVGLPEAALQPLCETPRRDGSETASTCSAADDGSRSPTGSGWGGIRTPTDDYIELRRKSMFPREARVQLPPRVYVDNRTLIREVTDLATLRRGDHCLTAINLVRCANPVVDYAISFLGSIEICYLYHHFIMVDDVEHVDELGVPRNADGKPAMIFECGNTIPEALTEIYQTTFAQCTNCAQLLWSAACLPFIIARFILFCKAKYTTHPLADYGDTPHIYSVVGEHRSVEERDRALEEALRSTWHPNDYHFVFNNCEHMCNTICRGFHESRMVSFSVWVFFRIFLGVLGLFAFRWNQDMRDFAGACYDIYCIDRPRAALAAYHLFTTVPVALQAMISYILLTRSVWRQHGQELIDRHECYHILGKELGRAIIVGGFTIAAIALTPQVVSSTLFQFVVCAFAYAATDMAYNCCAHAVMRLVLLPTWGRVWLLGPDLKNKVA